MKYLPALIPGLVVLLVGCAGGPILVEPQVSATDLQQARSVLSRHQLEPSRNPDEDEMWDTIERVHGRLWPAILATCRQIFSHGCQESMQAMDIRLVQDETVNAYADSEKYVIGIHTGLMRSAGSDDEFAWVLAHEAAHLLFGHAHKKIRNAVGYQVLGAATGWAIGAALGSPQAIEDLGNTGADIGVRIGYLAYSPEMELEADQFAGYVMKKAGYRPEASLSMIVRLYRGEVSAPVRRGDGWAGYLDTHPADDHRLAAMTGTIADIQRPDGQAPLIKGQDLPYNVDANQVDCAYEFRRRWPNCHMYKGGGNSDGISAAWNCSSPYGGTYKKLWSACGDWVRQCFNQGESFVG